MVLKMLHDSTRKNTTAAFELPSGSFDKLLLVRPGERIAQHFKTATQHHTTMWLHCTLCFWHPLHHERRQYKATPTPEDLSSRARFERSKAAPGAASSASVQHRWRLMGDWSLRDSHVWNDGGNRTHAIQVITSWFHEFLLHQVFRVQELQKTSALRVLWVELPAGLSKAPHTDHVARRPIFWWQPPQFQLHSWPLIHPSSPPHLGGSYGFLCSHQSMETSTVNGMSRLPLVRASVISWRFSSANGRRPETTKKATWP